MVCGDEAKVSADEIVFVPKYVWRHRFAMYATPVMAVLGIVVAVAKPPHEPGVWAGLLMFVVGAALLWLMTVKRVRFGPSIVVERYLRPPRSIEYSSIVDVGSGVLKTTRRPVAFTSMNCSNVDEFDAAVAESRRRGYWSETQLKGEIPGQQAASARSQLIAIPVSIVGAVAATVAKPGGLRYPWIVWWIAIYLPLALGLYAYFRHRQSAAPR